MNIYAENILDHFRNPRNRGEMSDATVEHAESNAECGDDLILRLKIENEKITDAGWEGTGCAISQAGMSILSELIIGMTRDQIMRMSQKDIYEILGVPIGPRRFKCALMSLHAAKNTVLKSQNKPPQSWTETVAL